MSFSSVEIFEAFAEATRAACVERLGAGYGYGVWGEALNAYQRDYYRRTRPARLADMARKRARWRANPEKMRALAAYAAEWRRRQSPEWHAEQRRKNCERARRRRAGAKAVKP